jgi:hypothetical protein
MRRGVSREWLPISLVIASHTICPSDRADARQISTGTGAIHNEQPRQ